MQITVSSHRFNLVWDIKFILLESGRFYNTNIILLNNPIDRHQCKTNLRHRTLQAIVKNLLREPCLLKKKDGSQVRWMTRSNLSARGWRRIKRPIPKRRSNPIPQSRLHNSRSLQMRERSRMVKPPIQIWQKEAMAREQTNHLLNWLKTCF